MATDPIAEGPRALAEGVEIRPARVEEIEEMLPMVRAYCEFYETEPKDDGLREMVRTVIEDPSQGAVFIARDQGGRSGSRSSTGSGRA